MPTKLMIDFEMGNDDQRWSQQINDRLAVVHELADNPRLIEKIQYRPVYAYHVEDDDMQLIEYKAIIYQDALYKAQHLRKEIRKSFPSVPIPTLIESTDYESHWVTEVILLDYRQAQNISEGKVRNG